jgi:hypothetical protein
MADLIQLKVGARANNATPLEYKEATYMKRPRQKNTRR